MKKQKILLSTCMVSIMLLSSSLTTVAAEINAPISVSITDNNLDGLNQRIEQEIKDFVIENEIKVTLEDFNFSISKDAIGSLNFDEKIEQDIKILKQQLLNVKYNIIKKDNNSHIAPLLVNVGNNEYIAEVWAGVPAIGWTTVKQDFEASISNNKINSITMLGDGYTEGISWGIYNHNRSWAEIYSNKTKVNIYIKGTINYTLDILDGGYSATFLEELELSGNSLVRQW